MKTFTQYLEEGRDAPLYHSTTMNGLLGILRYGKIVAGTGANAPHYISVTRDRQFALKFSGKSTIVIQLDQRKISQVHPITPIADRGYTRAKQRSESEEVIYAKDGIDLKYATKYFTARSRQYILEHVDRLATAGLVRSAGLELFRMLDSQNAIEYESK